MIEAILCASTGGLITFFWLFLHLDTVSATAAESQKPAGGSTLTHMCVTAPFKDLLPLFCLFLFFTAGDSSRRRTRRVKWSKSCSEKGSQHGNRRPLSRSHLLGSSASNPC